MFWFFGNHFNWHDFKLTTTYDHILSMKDETTNFKQPSFKLQQGEYPKDRFWVEYNFKIYSFQQNNNNYYKYCFQSWVYLFIKFVFEK